MEFLMTYGWAILVVLAAIGALAYFGVLSPGNLLPEKTTFKAPFLNTESAVVNLDNSDNIVIQVPFTNSQGSTVTISESEGMNVTGDCADATSIVLDAEPNQPGNGEEFILTWTCNGAGSDMSSGDKFKGDLSFQYQTQSGLNRTHSGSVIGKIQ